MTFSLTFSHLRGNFTSWGEDTALPHPYVVFKAGGQKTQTKVRSGQRLLPRAFSFSAFLRHSIVHSQASLYIQLICNFEAGGFVP